MSKAGKSSRGVASEGAGKRLQLAEVLDLTAATPLSQSFLAHGGAELIIDASRVRRVGAQCLQVFVAAAAAWKAEGVSLRLENPSEELLEGARLLGVCLDQEFERRDQAR